VETLLAFYSYKRRRRPVTAYPNCNECQTNDGAGSSLEAATGEPINMGRQTQLHMLPQDMKLFLGFVRKRDPVVVTTRSSDSPRVTPVSDPSTKSEVMTLWNKALLGSLERKLIHRPGGSDYYRVDDSLPTLELSPSRLTEWRGKPALLQGRIYSFFDNPTSAYEVWYKAIAQWIRRNFPKNPLKLLGGYVGPSALRWFQAGGVLLPTIEPPPTPEWLSIVENQHSVASSTPS
jgi:hypothetical protein